MRMLKFLALILLLEFVYADTKLSDYIKHFESLSYNAKEIHERHLRVRRSIPKDPFVHISFQAHGRHFDLQLRPDSSVFSPKLQIDVSSGNKSDIDFSHIYKGHLLGEPDTFVFGSIRDGVFDGQIYTPTDIYYIERAHKYFLNHYNVGFHSVIYKDRDVVDIHADKRTECGVTKDFIKQMKSNGISNTGKELNLEESKSSKEEISLDNDLYKPGSKYSKMKNSDIKESLHRQKRQTSNPLGNKRLCSLYIQTDTLLWDHIYKQENNNPSNTKREILSMIQQHIEAVNYIFGNTAFGDFKGIQFVVQRITINDTSACSDDKRKSNPFCNENIDVSNFLDLNSQSNHSDFCLAYIFTYRDFNGGTVGLAWVAYPEGSGVCDKFHWTSMKDGKTAMRSLNTGIVTFINYNSPLPPKISQLTLTHEIGHNFGSPHDNDGMCAPGGSAGNYIMYAKATSGKLPNNNKFSSCSIGNITAVLKALVSSPSRFCFQEINDTFCGNKIVEEGEECDCGFDDEECEEKCCYPKMSASPCKLKPYAQCSPSQGPCCTSTCKFTQSRAKCRAESDCRNESYCDGLVAFCPVSEPKDNFTECNSKTRVCLNGECTGSICLKYDMEECFLTKERGATSQQMCQLACQYHGNVSSCRSTFNMGEKVTGIKMLPGTPCDNYKGYCDVLQKCRAVDSDSPLARLKNLFSENNLLTIGQWITIHWWAVALMGLGFIILMGTFIKCCAVHTPSSNPNRPRARSMSETLRKMHVPTRNKRREDQVPQGNRGQRGHPPPPFIVDEVPKRSNYNDYSNYDEFRYHSYQREAPNYGSLEMHHKRY